MKNVLAEERLGAHRLGLHVYETELLGSLGRFGIEIVCDFQIIRDEPQGNRNDGFDSLCGEYFYSVIDVGLQPWCLRRTGTGAGD